MNHNGSASWKTKEDVLQDLGVIGQTKINDDYLVIGSGPPPPLKESVDDEYDLRFGGATYSEVTAPPDLNGIQQFLRMLQDDEPSDDENILQKNEVLVISKLNPLVKEFVPRALKKNSPRKSPRIAKSSSSSYPSNDGASKNIGKYDVLMKSNLNSPRDSLKSVSKSTSESFSTKSDIQKNDRVINKEEAKDTNENVETEHKNIMEKTNELRNKISETLKSDSPIHKKERNVAIANLLRLHSAKPSPCSSNTNISILNKEKELKLYTPDYFMYTSKDVAILPSSSNSDKLEKTDSNSDELEDKDPNSDELEDKDPNSDELEDKDPNIDQLENKDPNIDQLENKDLNSDELKNKDLNSDELKNKDQTNETGDMIKEYNTSTIAKVEPMDAYIQESIEKVNNWLKPKSPTSTIETLSPTIKTSAVCMRPVSFKRKEVNGKSPTLDSKIAKSNAPVAQFKPSKYADDLAKKYMERSQEIERRELSIWDNLEKELKKKDDEIKKKQAATLV